MGRRFRGLKAKRDPTVLGLTAGSVQGTIGTSIRGGDLCISTAWGIDFGGVGRRWIWIYSGPMGPELIHIERSVGLWGSVPQAVVVYKSLARSLVGDGRESLQLHEAPL